MPANFVNGTETDRADWAKAIAYISQTPEGAFLAGQLWTNNLTVVFTYDGNDSYDNVNNILYWDSKSTLNVVQPNGEIGAQSAALGLLHELYHWYTKKITGGFDEYLATAYETRAADLLGEPARAHYNAIYSVNPSAHADDTTASAKGGYWKKVEEVRLFKARSMIQM